MIIYSAPGFESHSQYPVPLQFQIKKCLSCSVTVKSIIILLWDYVKVLAVKMELSKMKTKEQGNEKS